MRFVVSETVASVMQLDALNEGGRGDAYGVKLSDVQPKRGTAVEGTPEGLKRFAQYLRDAPMTCDDAPKSALRACVEAGIRLREEIKAASEVVLPAFELLKRQSDPPHVSRIVMQSKIANEHGALIEFTVWRSRAGDDWWVAASLDGMRMSNTLHTRDENKAQRWIEAVNNKTIRIAETFSRAGQYIVIEGERDERGRVLFTMYWSQPDGVDNPSPQQIPRKRAQCFRAIPEEHTKRGAVIVKTEAEAKRLAWGE